MSFVHPTGAALKKKRVKKKPQWDNTVKDLNVYKASPEEVERRKVVHKSTNLDLVKEEKFKKKVKKAKSQNKTPMNARKNAVIREILFNSSQLQDALSKSDNVMSVVQDLFGDDPKRFRGLPNVTVAPKHHSADESLPDGTTIGEPSKLDILSDSVMDKTALNESDDQNTESESVDSESVNYEPALDMARFQQLLMEAERDDVGSKGANRFTTSMADRAWHKLANAEGNWETGRGNQDGSILATPSTTPKVLAINDTEKIQRHKARTEQLNLASGDDGQADTANLKKVLDGLETSMMDYERQIGQPSTSHQAEPISQGETNSTYTMALVDSVAKLATYLKQTELRLRAETTLREQLEQDVSQLKTIVNGLTTDVISTQEEYLQLQVEYSRYKQHTQNQLSAVTLALESHGIRLGNTDIPQYPNGQKTVSQELEDIRTHSLPVSQPAASEVSTDDELARQMSNALRLHTSSLPVPQAVLLTPPHQTNSPKLTGGRVIGNRQALQAAVQSLQFEQPAALQQLIEQQRHAVQQQQPGQTMQHVQQQQPGHTMQHVQQQQPGHTMQHQPAYPAQVIHPDPQHSEQLHSSHPLLSRYNQSHPQTLHQQPLRHQEDPNEIQAKITPTDHNAVQNKYQAESQTRHVIDDVKASTEGDRPIDPDSWQRQLLELNRQHAEAQSKLQHMRIQQAESRVIKPRVSPSISPITVSPPPESSTDDRSDVQTYQPPGKQSKASTALKTIRVCMPRVETVAWGDSPSPPNKPEKNQRLLFSHQMSASISYRSL